ncbi:Gfo/Idh/MocA family oxidoreductase, partial [bacterium]|nr:Gfo/Idh/MocA family oxidoreductase [bacterium]
MLRVATIGAWGHLGAPIAEMNDMDDVQIVALARAHADEDPEPLRTNRCVAADAPVFDDHQEMLAAVQPDVAIVSTRLDRLNPCAVDAARAGAHLIMEKPLAASRADLALLCDALDAKDVHCISTMSGNAGEPCLLAVRRLVDDGALGRIVMVNARKSYPWSDDRPEQFPRRLGGIIGWVGVHALSFIHTATGETFTSAVGMESHQLAPDRFAECPDHCGLVLGLSGGGHATVSLDYHRPRAAASHGDDWIRVVGTEGVVQAHLPTNTVRLLTHEAPDHAIPLPQPRRIFEEFLRSLMTDGVRAAQLTDDILMLTRACLTAQEA